MANSAYAAKLPNARPTSPSRSRLRARSRSWRTLARHTEHRADLLERVLPSALEAEVQAQHPRVARRERPERELDLVREEAVHRLFLGVRHLVGNEPLDEG